jgi:predicted methyltransferase
VAKATVFFLFLKAVVSVPIVTHLSAYLTRCIFKWPTEELKLGEKNKEKYITIGESERMTLKFVK